MSTETNIGGYRLVNLMMTGQTSQVWEVVEPGSGRHMAMKLLLPENTRAETHRNFLFHEATVGMALSHPNCIKIYKLVRDRNNPYIIMEFFPGLNLKLRLMKKLATRESASRVKADQQDLVRERCHHILSQAAAGLAHINAKGWVHRDVKPDNILVNGSAEVRIIDFALAKRIGARTGRGFFGRIFGRSTTTSGTRSYMSPEQILGKPLDARADLYSFGATMYEVVTGRPPFRGASPGDLLNKHIKEKPVSPQIANPEVTDECAKLILRLLAKDRKDRPLDFNDFLAAFRMTRVFKGDKLERIEA